jgi:hypothetical protein
LQKDGQRAGEIPGLKGWPAIVTVKSFHRRVLRRQRRHERLARRKLKNFSKNRPETTNLNHQYAIRRVFIDPSSCWRGPAAS